MHGHFALYGHDDGEILLVMITRNHILTKLVYYIIYPFS